MLSQSTRNQEKEHETFIAKMKTTIARHQSGKRIGVKDLNRQSVEFSYKNPTLIDRMRDVIIHHNKSKNHVEISSNEQIVNNKMERLRRNIDLAVKIQTDAKTKSNKPNLTVDTTKWDFDDQTLSPYYVLSSKSAKVDVAIANPFEETQ